MQNLRNEKEKITGLEEKGAEGVRVWKNEAMNAEGQAKQGDGLEMKDDKQRVLDSGGGLKRGG